MSEERPRVAGFSLPSRSDRGPERGWVGDTEPRVLGFPVRLFRRWLPGSPPHPAGVDRHPPEDTRTPPERP